MLHSQKNQPHPDRLAGTDIEAEKNWRQRLFRLGAGRGPTLLLALLFATVYNFPFWRKLLRLPDISLSANAGFLAATLVILVGVFFFFLTLTAYPYLQKSLAVILLLLMGPILYFSSHYGVIIDHNMISNLLETDTREAAELLSPAFLGHLLLLVILPAALLIRRRQTWAPTLRQTGANLLCALLTLMVIGGTLFAAYDDFALIGRSHRFLRLFLNPSYALYSVEKYYRVNHLVKRPPQPLAEDARISPASGRRKKLLGVFVVGESARAANFSLNGYQRETNPRLKQENIISFTQAYACGTSTAEALPGMFSHLPRKDYSVKKAAAYENVLDILQRLGVAVLWRDNNSSAKGVAERIFYEKLSLRDLPKARAASLSQRGEIFDEALLLNLDEFLAAHADRDLLIVLHQKGSHGPAYHKRRPPAFARFQPEYQGEDVHNASREELINAYDNTILYTDFFLARLLDWLKNNSAERNSFMIYMSDHGESLGENGIYLHSLPWFMAPDEQIHIGAIAWFSPGFGEDRGFDPAALRARRDQAVSHDFIFHTLLGLYKVESKIYNPELDLLKLAE
ncbi:MAG TPA: phosphoethanolamine--lipid A transferase [Proteobacteria bacterium]|nr:phosphoethanolamine--lipid A transferase [Pseudomonadota bacterium]